MTLIEMQSIDIYDFVIVCLLAEPHPHICAPCTVANAPVLPALRTKISAPYSGWRGLAGAFDPSHASRAGLGQALLAPLPGSTFQPAVSRHGADAAVRRPTK